jgi:hypothetical protein
MLKPIIDPILDSKDVAVWDKLDAVVEWIRMPELEEDDEAYATTTKYTKSDLMAPVAARSNPDAMDEYNLDKQYYDIEVTLNDKHTHTKTDQPPVIYHPSEKTTSVGTTELKSPPPNEYTPFTSAKRPVRSGRI